MKIVDRLDSFEWFFETRGKNLGGSSEELLRLGWDAAFELIRKEQKDIIGLSMLSPEEMKSILDKNLMVQVNDDKSVSGNWIYVASKIALAMMEKTNGEL